MSGARSGKLAEAPGDSGATAGRYVHLSPSMTFTARVAGADCSCLLDTGSSLNVISKAILDMLPRAPRIQPTATVARTASQEVLPLLGRVVLCFEIANLQYTVPCYVSDKIDVPVLLGLEFLRVCPCVIDMKRRCLILAPAETVRSISVEAVSVGKVVNAKDISVPPGAELILRGFLPNCDYRGPAIVEPILEIENLEIVSALVNVSSDSVPVAVRNISSEPISVPRRSELAQLEVGFVEESELEQRCQLATGSQDKPPVIREEVTLEGSNISPEEKERFWDVLGRYESMFDGHLGHSELVTHSIDTGSCAPIRQAPRRIPPHLREEVKGALDELVTQGVLEESEGTWASPICLVRRRNGKLRICADFRRLNAETTVPAYHIPRIDDTLEALAGSSLFIVLDFNSAFHQVSVDPKDRDKTTIVTPFGSYRHRRMPMGLSGSPVTCARLLDIVLADLSPKVVLSYFDDVILHGRSFNELLTNLDTVLGRLSDAGLTLNLKKCLWFQPSVTFLGHVVSEDGLRADPVKVEKVRQWPVPKTAKQLARFLGLAAYFRKYISGFASLAAPLFRLTNKDVRFIWSNDAQAAFVRLKDALCSAPVLALPRFDKDAWEFILECDASVDAVGAVLLQRQDGRERLIAYGSRRMSKSEKNYGVTKKELLSVVVFVDYSTHTWLENVCRCGVIMRPYSAVVNAIQKPFRDAGALARDTQSVFI